MTDQEINEAVAKKLGWYEREHTEEFPMFPVPDYCHDIKAAFEIVEHLRKKYEVSIGAWHSGFRCVSSGPTWKQAVFAEADTAPMAICLAFLKVS